MPWIEGIGDEVTLFFSIVIAFCILAAAWFSTGIRDIPFISVMIVQLTRRRRPQESAPSGNVEEESQDPDELQTSLTTEGDPETHVESSDAPDQRTESIQNPENVSSLQQPQESATVIDRGTDSSKQHPTDELGNSEKADDLEVTDSKDESENLSSTELRKRRLEFLSGNNKSCDTQLSGENKEVSESDNLSSISEQSSASLETKSHPPKLDTSQNETQSQSPRLDASTDRLSDSNGASNSPDNSSLNQTVESEEGAIRVKIKFLNDTQRQVEANLNETIGSFRRRHFPTEISESKLVRFIYNGQDLRNDASTLQSYNIGDNSVLHCLITQPRPEEHPTQANIDDNGLDIGVLMFPLFGLLLSIVWYARFVYRQIFNVTSTLTLSGITFLYLAALLSSLRGPRVHEHVD